MSVKDKVVRSPQCSILICTNSCDEYFVDALESCLTQSFTFFEVIIVVNRVSDDVYADIISLCKDSRIKLIRTDARYLSYNLNIGLQHASTDYIMRMDADDICKEDRLEKQFEYMKSHEDVVVCGCSYHVIDEFSGISGSVSMPENNSAIRRQLYFSNPFAHPSVMFRKNIILSIGGYMGGVFAQDYDLWVRVAVNKKYKFHNLQEKLILYRSLGGEARRSKCAYSVVSSVQYGMFVVTLNPVWLLSSLLTFIKRIVRGV